MRAEERIKKFRNLKRNWFSQDSGEPINEHLIQFLLRSLKSNKDAWECLRVGTMLPNLDGTLSIEWNTNTISTEIMFRSRYAYYNECDHTDEQKYKEVMDTYSNSFWSILNDRIQFNLGYTI